MSNTVITSSVKAISKHKTNRTQNKQQQAQQSEQQAQQQAQQMEAEKEITKEDREDGRAQLDSDTKIKVATINAEARLIDADDNNDGYVDRKESESASEQLKNRTDQNKIASELGLKKEELKEKKRANKANESIKRKAAKSKPTSK